jgi:hypothetical protein
MPDYTGRQVVAPAPQESCIALIRFVLFFGVIVLGLFLIVAHGLRGLVALVVMVLLVTAPQTRAWQVVERFLVRITGSRRRAAVLVLGTIIVIALGFEIYALVHE